MRKSFIIVVLLIGSGNLIANQALITEAETAFSQKDYDQCIQIYNQLLGEGYADAAIHYNIGNAYMEQDELGYAILHYNKALKFQKNDEDILHNLDIATRRKIDHLEAVDPFFLSRWWHNFRNVLSSNTWSIFSILLIWISIAGLFAWWYSQSTKDRKKYFVMGTIGILGSILVFITAYSSSSFEAYSGDGIIIDTEIQLRAAPDSTSTSIISLHGGTEITVLDQIGEWKKVRLINGEQGWLPVGSFKII